MDGTNLLTEVVFLVKDCNNCLDNDIKAHHFETKMIVAVREVGRMSNFRGHDTSRALFLNKEGSFPENKKGFC